MSIVASRYSEALLQIAIEQDKVLLFREELSEINLVFIAEKNMKSFFSSPKITKSEKKQVLKNTFRNTNALIMNFLYLLVDRNRLSIFEEIKETFINQSNEILGIALGIVYSVRVLDKQEIAAIEKSFSRRLQKKVYLENIIDSTLISGIKVDINQTTYDGSFKHELGSLKEYLLELEVVSDG